MPNRTRDVHQALVAFGFLTILIAVTVALAAVIMQPPQGELIKFAFFLPVSGLASLLLGVAFTQLNRGRFVGGVQGKLMAAVMLAVAVILLNVAFTSYLMFLSSHDLKLLALLLLFSLGVASLFSYYVASSFQAGLREILLGVESVGSGNLATRIELRRGDELERLSEAINDMARQLEGSHEERNDLEEARRHLIAAVSHDLRTPLATMRAMIESINDGVVTESSTIARYHRAIQGEIIYLSQLIDDLFDLSQIDSGALKLKPEICNVWDLVSGTLEVLRPEAEQRSVLLDGHVENSLPAVPMDMLRMQRVLNNLVQNAIRHTPADGAIWIKAVDAGEVIAFSVEDTGEGVEPDDLPRVFDRFYRGNRARGRADAGSGLGLTIAKGIVELHGGRIWAESMLGKGSTFVFTVPKAAVAQPL